MADIKNRAVSFLAATFILAAALTLAQGNSPVATLVPPAKFDSTIATTTQASTTLTTNATTIPPTTNATTPSTTNATTIPPTTNATTPSTTNATTPSTTNATTPATTNATTPAITNATTTAVPEPTKPAKLTLGNYTITEGDRPCIILKAAIQIHVNTSQVNGTFIVQPSLTQFNGECQKDTSGQLELSIGKGVIVLGFVKNETTKMVYANSVAVNLSYAFTSGATTTFSKLNKSVQVFSMSASHSYSCKSEMVYLGDGINLEFSQERLQAFDFGKDGQFGPVDMCKADQPNYNVAIAVGIVLIVLIVIVVIAYLVSRRKRTDGYQTL